MGVLSPGAIHHVQLPIHNFSTHELEIGGLRANSCWVTMVDNPRRVAPGEVGRVVLQLTAPHSVGEFWRRVELATSFGRFQVRIEGTVKPSRLPAAAV